MRHATPIRTRAADKEESHAGGTSAEFPERMRARNRRSMVLAGFDRGGGRRTQARNRELPDPGGRCGNRAVHPQQASGGSHELPRGENPPVRPRRDLPGGDRVRSAAQRPVDDGLHREARLGRVSGGREGIRRLDASPGDGQASSGEQADRRHAGCGEGCRRSGRSHPAETQGLKINLMGWSWGTAIMGMYTSEHNDKVNRLVLYAPLWLFNTAPLIGGDGPLGAYRTVSKDSARDRWLKGVAEDKKADLIPAGWFEQWADATWASDPESTKHNPPILRAPNGVLADLRAYWLVGKPQYDPANIKVPTLLIHAEWDADLPSYQAHAYFAKLANAPYKRFVELGEGTHTIIMEKSRMQFFREAAGFLDKDDIVTWQRILNAKGWAVPNWPVEWGGQDWSPVQQYIWLDELQQAPAPSPLPFNVSMVGPVIAQFGDAAQKQKFLPRCANLDDWWCQGFSEPGAGSDLASLKTSAKREG